MAKKNKIERLLTQQNKKLKKENRELWKELEQSPPRRDFFLKLDKLKSESSDSRDNILFILSLIIVFITSTPEKSISMNQTWKIFTSISLVVLAIYSWKSNLTENKLVAFRKKGGAKSKLRKYGRTTCLTFAYLAIIAGMSLPYNWIYEWIFWIAFAGYVIIDIVLWIRKRKK